MTRTAKHSLLASLYVTQYLPIGFFFIAVPAILRSEGFSLERIGTFYIVALPWVLKAFWAPLIDRYRLGPLGHLRGWLLLMQGSMVCTLLLMAALSLQTQFWVVVLGALCYATLSATQDVAADALAVRVLSPDERGFGNGVQTAGGFLGSLVGGGVMLVVYAHLGWSGTLLALAAVLALPLAQVWRYREPENQEGRGVARYRDLFSFFRQPGINRWVLVLLLVYLASSLIVGLVQPLLVDKGWSLARIGFLVNILANGVGVVGAMLTGVTVHRLGRKRGLLLSFGLMALMMIGFLPIALGNTSALLVTAVMSCFYLFYALSTGCVSTLCMDRCRPACGGSDFTVQASLASVLGLLASGAGVALAGSVGYSSVIVLALVLAGITTGLIARLLPAAATPSPVAGEPVSLDL